MLVGGKSEKSNLSLFDDCTQHVVLPGDYLFLHYVYPKDLDIPRQNDNMI